MYFGNNKLRKFWFRTTLDKQHGKRSQTLTSPLSYPLISVKEIELKKASVSHM